MAQPALRFQLQIPICERDLFAIVERNYATEGAGVFRDRLDQIITSTSWRSRIRWALAERNTETTEARRTFHPITSKNGFSQTPRHPNQPAAVHATDRERQHDNNAARLNCPDRARFLNDSHILKKKRKVGTRGDRDRLNLSLLSYDPCLVDDDDVANRTKRRGNSSGRPGNQACFQRLSKRAP